MLYALSSAAALTKCSSELREKSRLAGNLVPSGTVSSGKAELAHAPLSRSHTGWSAGQHEEPSVQQVAAG